MDAVVVLALIALDIATIIVLGIWCAGGGNARVLLGLVVSAVLGPVFGVPIYAVTVLAARWRRRRISRASG